jgi:beta-propeller repeat-containing protein
MLPVLSSPAVTRALLAGMTAGLALLAHGSGAHGMPRDMARMPLGFEPNGGRTDPDVRFLARDAHGTAYFTPREVVFALDAVEKDAASIDRPRPEPPRVARLRFVDANPAPAVVGGETLQGRVSLLIGNDASRWRRGLPTYGDIRYTGLYPGIDLGYEVAAGRLKGTFLVAPGADPSCIRWRYHGASELSLEAGGDLLVRLGAAGDAALVEQAPLAWQDIGGERRAVHTDFDLGSDGTVGFSLGSYDPAHALAIDPTIAYSTYLGGNNDDAGFKIALDPAGNIYVAGIVNSTNFPTVTPAQDSLAGGYDVFVAKLNPAGDALIYSTYIGGSENDLAASVAVDAAGSAYVTGNLYSLDYPVVNAYQPTNAGGSDVFITKLSPDGTSLVYSTYLGGGNFDYGFDMTVTPDGEAFVTGNVTSTNFPVVNAVQATFGGGCCDAFAVRLRAAGDSLVFSTYLGGTDIDEARDIALDSAGNVYLAGVTASPNFPLASAFQSMIGGNRDAFVSKLAPDGSALVYSTYLGGVLDDQASAMTVDAVGAAYLAGRTQSPNFPTVRPYQLLIGSLTDAFVSKLSAAGDSLAYSTFLGGSGTDYGYGIAVDAAGSALVTGQAGSTNFPTARPFQSFGGGTDAFVTKLSPQGDSLVYSSTLGGTGDEGGLGIVENGSGVAYVTGFTRSSNFPLLNAFQDGYGGGPADGFITEIFDPPPVSVHPDRMLRATLLPPWPNPASRAVTLSLELQRPEHVSLSIQDLAGRQVRFFDLGRCGAGRHAVRWDRDRDDGVPVPSGVYFCRLLLDSRPVGQGRATVLR